MKELVDVLAHLEHLFPATIHPMVVHFTIAIVYLGVLEGFSSFMFRVPDFLCLEIVTTTRFA